MTPDDVSTAIADALRHGGQQWLVGTVVAILPALWTMSLILQLGRPYIVRALRRFGLRLGADGWWLTFIILRDAVLVITLGLSLIFFQPNLVQNSDLPITGPIATLFLLAALAVKVWRRTDDDVTAHRMSSGLLVLGATLYFIPTIFAVEGGDQASLAGFAERFTSSSNPTAALDIMWACLIGVIILAAALFMWAMNSTARSLRRRVTADEPGGQPRS
jgi:hypothetical protein